MIDESIQKIIIKDLAKQYNVKVVFKRIPGWAGMYTSPDLIEIDSQTSIMLEVFFHELGHYYCWKNKIFPIYHNRAPAKKINFRNVMFTAYRAERWVDDWGKRECRKHFPNFPWQGAYRTKADKEFLYDNIKDEFYGERFF